MGPKRQSVSYPRTYAVLCVDDHAPGLNIRRMFLESFGYQVQTADSGEAALHLAAKHPFDAIILDYRMPGMDGLQLARALRQCCPQVPLIVLSGYVAEVPAELHGLISGFVTKGSDPKTLLKTLAEVTGGSPARKPPAKAPADLLTRSQQQLAESKQHVQRAREARVRAKGKPGRRSA